MMIDFSEIGNGDVWESFCASFLKLLNYQIIREPFIGTDNKVDLIVQEPTFNGFSPLKLIVSCKHHKQSISDKDEPNIRDRIDNEGCHGFIGFYSSQITATVSHTLNRCKERYKILIFTGNTIEDHILNNPKFDRLFCQYFPESYKKWVVSYGYSEQTKLFESFLNNLYPRQSEFLIALFGTSSNLLKKIRNHNNFYDALNTTGYEVRIAKSEYVNIMDGDSRLYKKYKKEFDERLNIKSTFHEFFLQKSIGLPVYETLQVICIRMPRNSQKDEIGNLLYDSKDYCIFCLSSNFLIVNTQGADMFSNMFLSLKRNIV